MLVADLICKQLTEFFGCLVFALSAVFLSFFSQIFFPPMLS